MKQTHTNSPNGNSDNHTIHSSLTTCCADLARSEAILSAISFIAEQFLRTNDLSTSIHTMMQSLGTATHVSRVYVFRNETAANGDLTMNQVFEWVADGIEAQINNPNLQGICYNTMGFARWAVELAQGNPLFGNVESFPETERPILEEQHILVIAVVPIFVGNTWWGFIGFDDCTSMRPWSKVEIEALRAAATMMGSAIHRSDVEEERLQLQQQIIEAQEIAIRELSTPLIPLSHNVVLLPLIGSIDTKRAQQVMETLLDGITTYQAKIAIVDITGVAVVDTQVANALVQAAQAVRLLGAQVILTGIGSTMAQTLVHLGADLSSIQTRGSLQSAVAESLRVR